MQKYWRALSDAEKNVFYLFARNYFYNLLLDYFDETASETVVRAILQTEMGYVEYTANPNESGRQKYFAEIMATAAYELNKLSESETAAIDSILMELYNHYLAIYESEKATNPALETFFNDYLEQLTSTEG